MSMGDFMAMATGIAAVLGAGLSIWNFLQSPSKNNAEAIEKVVTKLTDHDRRIQAVESEIKHLPGKDDVHQLKLAIVELQGTVKALDVHLRAVGSTVSNIDGYLRKDKDDSK